MTDIVERLRDRDAVVMKGLFHAIPTMHEAANEIERLRSKLASIFDGELVNDQCKLGDYCKCCAGKPRLCPNYEGPGAVRIA
jgi:hypothetical protein